MIRRRESLVLGVVAIMSACASPSSLLPTPERAHGGLETPNRPAGYQAQATLDAPPLAIEKPLSMEVPLLSPERPSLREMDPPRLLVWPRFALLAEINRVRRVEELPPLGLNPRLNNVAWNYAWRSKDTDRLMVSDTGNEAAVLRELARHDIFARRAGYTAFRIPKSAVAGPSWDRALAKAAVSDWMSEPTSRNDVLSYQFTHTGIAVIEADNGDYIVVQIFTGPLSMS